MAAKTDTTNVVKLPTAASRAVRQPRRRGPLAADVARHPTFDSLFAKRMYQVSLGRFATSPALLVAGAIFAASSDAVQNHVLATIEAVGATKESDEIANLALLLGLVKEFGLSASCFTTT